MNCIAIQSLCRDTAQAGRAGRRGRARRSGRAGRRRERGARGRGARHGRWARDLGVLLGWGCALGTLSLFLTRFDSILFLSQFLDIVREPGS